MESNFHLAARQSEQSWRALRRRRADPPRMVSSSGSRQKTFRAALEQAEQQLRAAAVIGYDSRPLNLFYGLSQGGRALAAASPAFRGEDWRLDGHGLHHDKSYQGEDVTAVAIEGDEKKASSFRRVSLALGSPQIEEMTLGELWPLMYETTIGQPLGEDVYVPLSLFTHREQAPDLELPPCGIDAAQFTVPAAIMRRRPEERPAVAGFLTRYPALEGAQPHGASTSSSGSSTARWPEDGQATVRWPEVRDERLAPDHVLSARLTRYRRAPLAMPTVHGHQEALHPLMVWWQVLFALSTLARYHPDRWTKMINIDSRKQAVAIEYVLDTAIDAVPDLLDEAFDLLDPPAGAASA